MITLMGYTPHLCINTSKGGNNNYLRNVELKANSTVSLDVFGYNGYYYIFAQAEAGMYTESGGYVTQIWVTLKDGSTSL